MRIALVIGSLLLSSFAFAQTSTVKKPASDKSMLSNMMKKKSSSSLGTSTAQLPSTSKPSSWYNDHVSAGVVISTGSELRNLSFERGTERGSGQGATQSGLAVMAQYKDRLFSPIWNWTGWLAIHQSKDISAFKGSMQDQKDRFNLESKPSFQPWVVGANAEYRLNDAIYFPAGLNITAMPMTHTGDLTSFSMSPTLGYQYGVGATIEKVASVELMYQSLRYNFEARQGNFKANGYAMLDGLNLQARYNF